MCTLIVATRYFPATPLLVAANRDERLDRPATPPFRWPESDIVAPRDDEAKGTWLGVNRHGVFVGITNRHLVVRHPDRPSRGRIVLDALAHDSAAAAFDVMKHRDAANENGFHLVMADAKGAYQVWGDGERLRAAALPPGVHVLTERSFDAAPTGREALLARHLARFTPEHPPTDDDLVALLSLRPDGGAFDDVAVHVPAMGYGTRSSSILRFTEDATTFLHASGPPTDTPFEDYSSLLK